MAETLGSLIDKLSINTIRLKHLKHKTSKGEIDEQMLVLAKQKHEKLMSEIDDFIYAAVHGVITIREPKLKIYGNLKRPKLKGKKCGIFVDRLIAKNLELWDLEDKVREKDINDSDLAKVKRKIDKVNIERNDLIDKLDELLENVIKEHRKAD